jgi:subtilisin family serine protease
LINSLVIPLPNVSKKRPARVLRLVMCLLLLGVAAVAPRVNAQPGVPSPSADNYVVILEGGPVADAFLKAKSAAQKGGEKTASTIKASAMAAAQARKTQIKAQHDAMAARLRSLGATELARHGKLVNAISIHATEDQVRAVRALPGVKAVYRSRTYEVNTASSVPFIGSPNVWGGISSADGTGVRIGIIDTGIDYTHADFGGSGNPADYSGNDRANIEIGTFPTAKIVGGYDFVGDSYTGGTDAVPDPDPLDCAGHGSHVAGIAAGFGVLTNGATFSGPYTNGMDFSQFKIGPGVAPRALLYALKVFGCSGSTRDEIMIQAVEWAADPNDDLDFSDRLDAVNLSIGSIFGQTGPDQPMHDALNMLADLGCVPVLSAGNSFDTFYIVGHPSTAEKAISVAASIDNGTTTLGTQVLSPSSIVTNFPAVEGAITVPLSQSGPKQANVVYVSPALACSSLFNSGSLPGAIALIDRGTCNFSDKILRAQNAGAIAVVMVNNVAGAPIIMGGSGAGITIPGLMISQSDGNLIKAHLSEGVVMRLSAQVARPELADRIADFSSRGPAAPNSLLKPEIAAPGFDIFSVKVGGGTEGTSLSGTSMAAPHVTGAAGLMRQLHPSWSTEDIKAAMMNTARNTRDAALNPYPESRVGAGRLQIDDAARAAVTIVAENSGGLVSLNFGALTVTNIYTSTRNLVLSNHSATATTYFVVVSNTVLNNGVTLTSVVSNVTVPANGSALVPVVFTANASLFDRTPDPTTSLVISGSPRHFLDEASGQIWFLNTNLSLHVPYYANVRAASAYHAAFTSLVSPITNTPVTLTIPLSGFSANTQALVSAFQVGFISTNQMLNALSSSADLLAVGTASDAALQSQLANSTVYFGLAAVGEWASPTPVITEFDILVDTNLDGIADITLRNESLSINGTYSDVFETGFVKANGSVTVYSFFNGFSANQRDTALFNNNVLVLPIPANVLGLTTGRSQFKYRVESFGDSTPVETTGWITFDIARPMLDTASLGISGRPAFADGTSVLVQANPNNAAANGLTSPSHAGLMLLHHFNASSSNRLELVDIQFAPKLLPPQPQPGGFQLSWNSASNAVYTLQYATNLNDGFLFTTASGIAATPPLNTFTVTTNSDLVRFYRLKQD